MSSLVFQQDLPASQISRSEPQAATAAAAAAEPVRSSRQSQRSSSISSASTTSSSASDSANTRPAVVRFMERRDEATATADHNGDDAGAALASHNDGHNHSLRASRTRASSLSRRSTINLEGNGGESISRAVSYHSAQGSFLVDEAEWANSKVVSRRTTREGSLGRRSGGVGAGEDPEKGDEEEDDEEVIVVQFDGDTDPMNPRNMPTFRKWIITLTVALASFCVTMSSSLYTTTYAQITEEFHVSNLVATIGLSTFVFGLGLSPMCLSPLSEFYGRRPIYVISFFCYFIWLIPCAVANNIATMLIARFFTGFAGSAFLSVAGGTVSDMFDQKSLQFPMMVFTASPFVGPGVGPVLGGFINSNVNWRWSFWVVMIFAGLLLISIVFLVPETYHPVLLVKKARKLRKETGDDRYRAQLEIHERSLLWTVIRSMYRPFQLLTMEFMVTSLCLFSAILLGILYLFFGSFHLVFTVVYDFTLWQVGLSFLGLLTGMSLAVASDPLWHKNYNRLVRNYSAQTGIPNSTEPEFRLPPAIGGAPFTTIGLFIFAWTGRPGIHWIAPMIGAGVFGFGTILVFSGIFTYLVQAFPLYAASALAANSFARSSFAAGFPLFGIQMYNKLTFPWASSLLAFLTLIMVPFPYIFFLYGKRLRQKSKFTTNH